MDGLPMLPGNTFNDPTQNRFHVTQTLQFNNGYQVPAYRASVGIGGKPLTVGALNQSELDDLANYQPSLTYGKAKPAAPKAFVPGHVAFDKKVLRFYGYFKETVKESPAEHFRVRHLIIYYYLEDDSIAIVEPPKENSGIPQGKFLRRQRLPRNEVGDIITWKDINVGTNLTVYGKIIRLTDCDKFTSDFLESEGVIVGQPESTPEDPYITKRTIQATTKTSQTPSAFDKRKQFIEMDRKVLRFYAIWDDRDQTFGECRVFTIHYYLVDDTMEVREVHQANDGRDPFPVLIRRGAIPKDISRVPPTFPSIAMEAGPSEICEYFSPKDFVIGKTVLILGRRFLIYEVDNFTKCWYNETFGITEFTPIKVDQVAQELAKMEIPPYNNFGSYEDSLGSCLSLRPQPAKKDYVKMLDNGSTVLRYEGFMDSIRPEDKGRRFIISYRLADDTMTIYESSVRNSGVTGGLFLARTRVPKPESTHDKPVYYSPVDFKIGGKIEVFSHRFTLTNCDTFVLKYLEERSNQYPADVIESVRRRLVEVEAERQPERRGIQLKRECGDEARMSEEIAGQLKKLAITDSLRIDDMFLKYNHGRINGITLQNLQEMCRKMLLPDDADLLHPILDKHGSGGKMSLEQFRKFFES